jgi:hypothetical protein
MSQVHVRSAQSDVIDKIRVTYAEQSDLQLSGLQHRVENLIGLLTILNDPETFEVQVVRLSALGEIKPPHSFKTLQYLTALNIDIEGVHYNPIFEIIFGAGVAVTALLTLWKRLSDARIRHANANIRKTEAEMKGHERDVSYEKGQTSIEFDRFRRAVIQDLGSRLQMTTERGILDPADIAEVDRMIERAARELAAIEKVEALDIVNRPVET